MCFHSNRKKEKHECKLVYKLDYEKMEGIPSMCLNSLRPCFVRERVGPEQIGLCREEVLEVEEK